ncbi:UDP-N-acetylglucosamine acetyltransferase [Candidatus Terasakiella magnetica]|uniref:Acyl-[acyl-carrier-protein]--UDP-N-acetylglucosamine O-acyltransferase n=1 Tax=Candidatus Terasakiella magnetica TaxID=1867952 RepID=A0A1C3RCT6_9PROT|nr:acyl-ACP--UDP-N-acetylglucosamine O-acyltransferase [Candidatus Terasakiella magnetica]SCA55032.1 UDP-N-acetylglucosamine acetyltransferase [Candidatus Terasakiella magnetica]
MANIHPSAVVDSKAQVAESAKIGPFCMVGPDAVIGENVELLSHVVVEGRTTIGNNNKIFPFASIGHCPQDLKYNGEPSRLEIGENNTIREHVTINPGTEGGGMLTKMGSNCLVMVGAHIGHDCQVGDNVILVNNATLAGHVTIEDWAIIGGLSAVHQFCRIGRHAMIGGMSGIENDVIPYGSVTGNRARLAGLNIVGLKRRNFDREAIHSMRTAYRLLFAQEGTMAERVEDVANMFKDVEPVMEIVKFIRQDSSRGVCTPK